MGKKSNRLPLEVRERAVRRLQDYRSEYPPLLAAIQRVYKIGSHCQAANGGLPAGQCQQHHRLQIDDFGQAVLQLLQQKSPLANSFERSGARRYAHLAPCVLACTN